MAAFFFPPPPALAGGGATAANQVTEISLLTDIESNTVDAATATKQDEQTALLTQIESNTSVSALDTVDQLDTPLLDTSSSNIPASASSPLQVVATTAADIKAVISIDDIGEYIGLYSGPTMTVLECILPLGGGQQVPVQIPAGTKLGLKNMKNSTINSGFIAINFLG